MFNHYLTRCVTIFFLSWTISLLIVRTSSLENKYTEDANLNVLHMRDPLRMAKLNVIWEKARKRLTEPKLRKLLSELKVQDKEELTLKKLKASSGDKEGLKEAELRKRLKKILKNYSLESHDAAEEESKHLNNKIEKATFKDKKLHKLWVKAEQSGLTQEELKILREEFQHHQDKIDEYHSLIEQASTSSNDDIPKIVNDVHNLEIVDDLEGSVKDYNDNINTIREKHREIKNGYNQLHRKASSGPTNKEFSDPKVSGLWKLALRTDFDDGELESLFTELKHYEARLHKLSFLSNELNKISLGKVDDELTDEDKEKILSATETEGRKILEERLEKQKRKTEKLHEDLEMRILARHSEL